MSAVSLLKKYDLPVPRYTSYPTVPYWQPDTLNPQIWLELIKDLFNRENGSVTLYIHLPFCESLCTFCACNKRITKNHAVEENYINAVLAEWKMYLAQLNKIPVIHEIHLGGGTPTFFSPSNLYKLVTSIISDCLIAPNHEFSVEVHPNYTTEEHIKALRSTGFNRISLGVQDFDPAVQEIINRKQTFEKTLEVVQLSRKYNFTSINVDLVYGLPLQTVNSVQNTIEYLRQIKPDRVAFYSYAHVPWKSKGQRRYTEADLPSPIQKWKMYQHGIELLQKAGYVTIGMDHFALPHDSLYRALANGKLHRNFMGYTTFKTRLIIGLGASAISDCWQAFTQNNKTVEEYQKMIETGTWAFTSGHLLNNEDLVLRKNILELMCSGKTTINKNSLDKQFVAHFIQKSEELEADGLLKIDGNTMLVTETGRLFTRNICALLDARMWRSRQEEKLFSRAI